MTEVRRLETAHFDEFIRLMIDAYPGLGMVFDRDKDKIRERMEERLKSGRVGFFGAFRGECLTGVMRVHDYTMNYRSAVTTAGGLGGVAVDLTCKRERVAGEMIRSYLDTCDEAGMPMAVLWPFRPDFYRKIGFGYGGKKYRYSLLPSTLPHAAGKSHVKHAVDTDYDAMAGCYGRIFANRHGMLDETAQTIKSTVSPANGGKAVVYRDGEEVRGFIIYRFVRAHATNFVANDLHVEECLYESPEVLGEFLSFLHSQHDQVRRILFDTPDAEFHYVPVDPRNDSNMLYPSVYHESHTAAVGAMYMVLSVPRLFELTPGAVYGVGAVTVEFIVDDPWWGKAGSSTKVAFAHGRAEVSKTGRPDIEIALNIADFSSLIMGAVRLSRLVEYGLAKVSKADRIGMLDQVLATPEPPYCFTRF